MENSKRYNSVPVKDNCVLFSTTNLFLGPHSPLTTPVAMATNFGTKINYNSALVKDNCSLFAPTP